MANIDNLSTIEILFMLILIFFNAYTFYILTSRLPRYGSWFLRIALWGISINIMELIAYNIMGKWALWPMTTAFAVFAVSGYTIIHNLYLLIPKYRRHPDIYLDGMKKVSLPKGSEWSYIALESFRERALLLDRKVATTPQLLWGIISTLPYAQLLIYPEDIVIYTAIFGIAAGMLFSLAFVVDLSASLIRYSD